MTVLVTGGAGYIGSHMTLALRDRGENVVVIDNLSTGFEWAVADGAKLVVADIADTDTVASVIRENNVSAIIHFAGSIIVPESVERPLDYYQNNT
ncbi:MAG: NAD-dependent epimerase/dehydratase family protein, partial [Pseudomonadota bacterium]